MNFNSYLCERVVINYQKEGEGTARLVAAHYWAARGGEAGPARVKALSLVLVN